MCRHTKRSLVCFVPALLACRPLSPVRFPHAHGSCQRWAIPRPSPDGCVPAAGGRRCLHGRCRCPCPPGAWGLTTRTQETTPLPWAAADRQQGAARQEARPPAVPHGARAIMGDEQGAERHRPAAWPERGARSQPPDGRSAQAPPARAVLRATPIVRGPSTAMHNTHCPSRVFLVYLQPP